MILRTTSLGNHVTRQDLYDLLYNSVAVSLTPAEIGTLNYYSLYCETDPPAGLRGGDLWYDMRWDLLRQFDADMSYALAIGPDRIEWPAFAAHPIFRGAIVRVDPVLTYSANGASLGVPWVRSVGTGGDQPHAWGVAVETALSGRFVPVAIGIVPAMFGASLHSGTQNMRIDAWPVAPASGFTGLIGGMSYSMALVVTHTWNVGHAVEYFGSSSAASLMAFINFVGPFKMWDYT